MADFRRQFQHSTVNIAASASVSAEAICVARDAGMAIKVPSEWTAADIGFTAAEDISSTFAPVYDDEGSRVKITGIATSASQWYDVPEAVMKHAYVKLASLDTGDGSAENQGAARVLVVMRKS